MNFSVKYLTKVLAAPVFVAMALTAAPALADCAQDIDSVKTVGQTSTLSDEDKAKVEMAFQAAQTKQAAGDEEGCVAEITPAKMILQIE